MVTDIKWTCDHFISYTNIKSLYYTLETNVCQLYLNFKKEVIKLRYTKTILSKTSRKTA